MEVNLFKNSSFRSRILFSCSSSVSNFLYCKFVDGSINSCLMIVFYRINKEIEGGTSAVDGLMCL